MIKILISHHTTPDVKTLRTMIFDKVVPAMRSKMDIDVIWLVYMPDKLKSIFKESKKVLDIHDFGNALDLIKRVNPDIIYAAAYPNLPDYALSIAGKYLKIPVIADVVNQVLVEDSLSKMFKLNISAFFEKSVPTDTNENTRQFMRRGRFWTYKYKFLLKTQLAIGMSIPEIIKNFFTIIQVHFSIWKKMNDPRFSVDYHFVEGELLLRKLIEDGYKESSLILTGNPAYDYVFDEIQKVQPTVKKDSKIRVLLLTHSMYEHGFWTRKQRDEVVTGIVNEICKHKDKMSLVVKIHPSSENLADYQSLITPIDPSIPIIQKGDVLEFIQASDVVIVYSTSSAPIQTLVLKKPIVMINLNLKGDIMLESGLVQECTNATNIITSINEVLASNPATEKKVDTFIRNYLYKLDGLSHERMSNKIIEIVKNQNMIKR